MLSKVLPVISLLIVVGVCLIAFQAWRFDPYSVTSVVQSPYLTEVAADGQIDLRRTFTPELQTSSVTKALAWARTGLRIPLYDFLLTEKPTKDNEAHIIAVIHDLRFNPARPYVITGGHYSDLYMRNLGIFFNALLDPRLATFPDEAANVHDWQNRQRIAVQTIANDLDFLDQNGAAVTTIAPTGAQTFTGLNIYAPPSDSLFSLFFTLKALTQPEFLSTLFPATSNKPALPLETQTITHRLLTEHAASLTIALNQYLDTTLDPQTGLVRRDIALSSARDGIKRSSSFYDNVIAWSTVQLADELGIQHSLTLPRETWKQKIMTAFWDNNLGIFRNDLTAGPTVFSADALIVTSSGFFDRQQPGDQEKLQRMLTYIQGQHLDQPFPLRYSLANSPTSFQLPVKFLAPSYMSDAIWSHWGMEYVKALLLLAPQHPDYHDLAVRFLSTYRQNIEKNGGYPELYNSDGSLFKSGPLRSVLDTGWVVNYEQAKVMAAE